MKEERRKQEKTFWIYTKTKFVKTTVLGIIWNDENQVREKALSRKQMAEKR